ncbi:HNH endonuclease signature motif containing protein [Tardiphaga sp. 862_B3_N1_1]|uniref:HNH endonuclease signature motif containing protein n=1 Tax=Tardiphaga sp. 862_B3_N1_1 TaxID=3240763 RepID=UPI003F8ADFC6
MATKPKRQRAPLVKDRRQVIIEKIEARCEIVDTGYVLDGKPSPCHVWQGPTSGTGRGGNYGRMSLDGQTVATHIVAYTHYFGFVPGKKQIDHKCRQRLCCNPAHLEMVTHKQNQRRRDQALAEAA